MDHSSPRNLPALIPGEPVRAAPDHRSRTSDPRAAAQLLGQDGQRRGLRGGPPVLKAARSAYLEAEFSGGYDRRPERGLLMRAAV